MNFQWSHCVGLGWGRVRKALRLNYFFFFGVFYLTLYLGLSGEISFMCQQGSGHVKLFFSTFDKVLPHFCGQPDVTIWNYLFRGFMVENTKAEAIVS